VTKTHVAFDIGGTFTDVVTIANGRLGARKVLSLLDQVGSDIVSIVYETEARPDIDSIMHATTICSNALIENKTARVGLLTTEGFRDTLELRAQRGPLDDSGAWRTAVLVPRDRVLELRERVYADGSVAIALDEEQVRDAVRRSLELKVDALAVCLLNSFQNASHELRVGEIIREMAPDLTVCLSSAVQPEIREYERTSTTVVNAALMPPVAHYLDRLEGQMASLDAPIVIMQSNGGITTSEAARRRPILSLESGPAGGVLAAARLARTMNIDRALAFDMGGTTAKACIIVDGQPLERVGGVVGAASTAGGQTRESGYSIQAPMIDLVEVGAGGGSIARNDLGVLRVGPHSAGADPGPICYSRGGVDPTVTDANVALGYVNPTTIAGGKIHIDRLAAVRALTELGAELEMDMLRTAYGVVSVANSVMMRALRGVTSERGHDPREFTMIAFGGGGAMHACAIAEAVGITTIVVPPLPGVFSAIGLLLADYRIDVVHSSARSLEHTSSQEILRVFEDLARSAEAEMIECGMPVTGLRFERRIDLRFSYQAEELSLDVPEAWDADLLIKRIGEEFDALHERQYGYVGTGDKIAVNFRLRAFARTSGPSFEDLAALAANAQPTASAPRSRSMYFGPEFGEVVTPVLRDVATGPPTDGPVVIEGDDATIVVLPQWNIRRTSLGALVLERMTQ